MESGDYLCHYTTWVSLFFTSLIFLNKNTNMHAIGNAIAQLLFLFSYCFSLGVLPARSVQPFRRLRRDPLLHRGLWLLHHGHPTRAHRGHRKVNRLEQVGNRSLVGKLYVWLFFKNKFLGRTTTASFPSRTRTSG